MAETPTLESVAAALQTAFVAARKQKNPNDDNKTLGEKIGVSEATVSNLRNGKPSNYTLKILFKIASYVEKPVAEIAGLLPPNEERPMTRADNEELKARIDALQECRACEQKREPEQRHADAEKQPE